MADEPQLRLTAAEFNAARAKARGGDLRKIDTTALTTPTARASGGNPTWPWLPPGVSGRDCSLAQPVAGYLPGTSAWARSSDPAAVLQVRVTDVDLLYVGGAAWTATLHMTPAQMRCLAAQLLNTAHQQETSQ